MKSIRHVGILCAVSLVALSIAAMPQSVAAGQKGHEHTGHQWCPPGLAKKGCIPPGQRKKWAVGDRLPRDLSYRRVNEWERYRLSRPPEGHYYGYVDNDILLIEAATQVVIDAVVLGILLN